MTLRKRLSWIAAASVAIAVTMAVIACYAIVRSQVRGQVTDSLRAQVANLPQSGLQSGVPSLAASSGGPAPYNQVVFSNGQVYQREGGLQLPINSQVLKTISGRRQWISDIWVNGSHLEMLCVAINIRIGPQIFPAVLQLARPLNGVDMILRHLRLFLILIVIGGAVIAAMLGRMASRRVLAPLAEVADVAQEIGETDDLTKRLHVRADDEVGQLATNFNAMLDRLEASREALDDSVRAQRQLVADASHELRTPVTSLRTNIEVLLEEVQLEPEDRRRLLADVVEQSEELTALVGDLIELARGDQQGPETDDVRLDGVASECLARARRNAPGIHFEATMVPTLIDGVPERLARAINNLLDNAARHSPAGGTVELQVGPHGVEVRDHGTGVDTEDLPYVFDRFFRGRNSRGRQGSGLGLAIVRQVAEQHGGSASVINAVDGGAIFTLHLPGIPAEPGDLQPAFDHQPAPSEPVESR